MLFGLRLGLVFGRPFVKRFALCYQTVVCPVCHVCDVAVLWPNSWMDQDKTWLASRPRPWPHCVRWGPSTPSPKGTQPPIFGPYPLRQNGWMDQDGIWHGDGRWSRHIVQDGDPAHLPKKWQRSPLPNFRSISIVSKRLDASRCQLIWR